MRRATTVRSFRGSPAAGTRRRGLGATVCLLVLGGLLGLWPVGAAVAGCTGPVLSLTAQDPGPPLVALASDLTVTGEWFHSGCDDTGQGSGCGAPPSEEAPLSDVELFVEQSGRSVLLGTSDAADRSDRYAIAWDVDLPAGLRPGPAVLRAAGAELPLQLTA